MLSLVTHFLDHDITGEKVIRFRDWPGYRQEIFTGNCLQEVGVNVTADPVLNYASRL